MERGTLVLDCNAGIRLACNAVMAPIYLGEFEYAVLLAVLHLEGDAYAVPIRELIEQRTTRPVARGALEARKRVDGISGKVSASPPVMAQCDCSAVSLPFDGSPWRRRNLMARGGRD